MTRRGTVRGLTTAASVWETAAIGMAAGAGLWLLAIVVTALHFVTAYGLRAVSRRLPGEVSELHIEIVYADGHGLLRQIIEAITTGGWTIRQARPQDVDVTGTAGLILEVAGGGRTETLVATLADIGGVRQVQVLSDDDAE